MKHVEQFFDLMSMGVGMIGALLKGIKRKYKLTTIVLSMLIAGILTFSVTGVLTMYYSELNSKVVILVSFCVGWISNEITDVLDDFVGDVYDIFINWLRNKYGNKK